MAFINLNNAWRQPLLDPVKSKGHEVCVALGKFDAMHIGHRLLAEEAARLGGYPCMLSFSGLAKELKLPERKPLTAEIDRKRVLQSWAPQCAGKAPIHKSIPFVDIRYLKPEEFVDVLAETMQVKGVVVGSNYRFGYQAQGDANLLHELGTQKGLLVSVLELQRVDGRQTLEVTSSSLIRECLESGKVQDVKQHLDRPYAVIVPGDSFVQSNSSRLKASTWTFTCDTALTVTPSIGAYEVAVYSAADLSPHCSAELVVDENGNCAVLSDETKRMPPVEYIRLELLNELESFDRSGLP